MGLVLITAPTEEPISRAEAKVHLRLDTGDGTIAEDVTLEAATYAAGADGSSSTVTGTEATLVMEINTVTSSTFTMQLQDSPDGSTWTAFGGSVESLRWTQQGSTGQATSFGAGDSNTTWQKSYTGTQPYVRAVLAFTAGSSANLTVRVIKLDRYTDQDELIDDLIAAARRRAENFLNRRFVTQTWDLMYDAAPSCDRFRLPWPPLQSITHIKYLPTDGSTLATLSTANYHISTPTNQPSYVKLSPNGAWPSVIDRLDAFQIRMVVGYGAASAVPETIKQAMRLMVGVLYRDRAAGDKDLLTPRVMDLLNTERWGW